MTKPDHSIVFLTYNRPVLIDQRLDEIDQHLAHRDDFEVVVFDNGSTDYGVRLVLISRSNICGFPLRIINQKPNIGFGKGFNKAVKHAEGEVLYIVSDDVAIFGDIIRPSLIHNPNLVMCHRKINAGAGWNDFPEISIIYPDGYFLAMHKSAWERLGGFDERFYPHDYEDLDIGMKILHDESLELIERPDFPIRHAAASTIGYSDARYEHTCKMRALFAEKWGLTNKPEKP